jgi:hypothetical protein
MSNKIKGSPGLLEKVRKATPFNTNIHVNLEALEELPEQFDAVLKAVYFDPKDLEKDFTKISGKYMPKTQLMYDIAEARGVSGSNFYIAKDEYQEVNVNPMFCKSLLDQPNMRIIHTGCSSTKQAVVTEEDGTESTGAPCTVVDSFWNECLKIWAKEEEATQGYDPSIVINGEYTYYNKKVTGKHYFVQNGQYKNAAPVKYDTEWKRRSFYESQKDLSQNMAQTKSWLKCIREKAGLITAYDPKDLQTGELIFSKIVKSSASLKMESLANLSAIEKGVNNTKDQDLLFGTGKSEIKNVSETVPEPIKKEETIQEPDLEVTPVEEAIAEIECALKANPYLDAAFKTKLESIVGWLKENPEAHTSNNWGMVETDLETLREMTA